MQLTREQFNLSAPLLPRQRGNVLLGSFVAVNAIYLIRRGQWLQMALAAQALRLLA